MESQKPTETTTPAPENTTKPATQSTTTPTTTDTTAQQAQSATVEPEPESGTDTQTSGSQSQSNKDGWDQAFYDTLTPEQKAIYEGLDASSRNQMKQNIEKTRQREQDGWITEGGTPTEEQLEEAWSHIQMGQ